MLIIFTIALIFFQNELIIDLLLYSWYTLYILCIDSNCVIFLAIVPDDDICDPLHLDDPFELHTPPTPLVEVSPSHLPTSPCFQAHQATCFPVHQATAHQVLVMDAGCGLYTRGQWRGPVTCNEWEWNSSQYQTTYTILSCRFETMNIM